MTRQRIQARSARPLDVETNRQAESVWKKVLAFIVASGASATGYISYEITSNKAAILDVKEELRIEVVRGREELRIEIAILKKEIQKLRDKIEAFSAKGIMPEARFKIDDLNRQDSQILRRLERLEEVGSYRHKSNADESALLELKNGIRELHKQLTLMAKKYSKSE